MVGARYVAGIVLVSLVAGCTAQEDPAELGAPSVEGDENAARLVLLVLSEEYQPIPGAMAGLEGFPAVTTDETGAAKIGNIPPGSYRLDVQALGYASVAQTLDLVAGQVLEHQVVLEVLPVVEPYVELLTYRGFAVCETNAVIIILSGPGGTPLCAGRMTAFPIEVPDTWRYLVVEAYWETADSLHLFSDNDSTCIFGSASTNRCFDWDTGRSPQRTEGEPNHTAASVPAGIAPYTYPGGAFSWVVNGAGAGRFQEEINGSAVCPPLRPNGPPCGGVGYNLGWPYNLVVSLFHNDAPLNPAAYSAIPDH